MTGKLLLTQAFDKGVIIVIGKDANLVIIGEESESLATYVEGRKVFDA